MEDIFKEVETLLKDFDATIKRCAEQGAKEDHIDFGVTKQEAFDTYSEIFSQIASKAWLEKIAKDRYRSDWFKGTCPTETLQKPLIWLVV